MDREILISILKHSVGKYIFSDCANRYAQVIDARYLEYYERDADRYDVILRLDFGNPDVVGGFVFESSTVEQAIVTADEIAMCDLRGRCMKHELKAAL